jgi:hypothetical protein
MNLGNVRTLLKDPIPFENIPIYPKFEIMVAKGGEITFDIDPTIKFADGNSVIPFERPAEKGEWLRDQSMMFVADTRANRLYRGEVLQRCLAKPHNIQLEMKRCASDINYFANVYCWTFIPGRLPVPFVLYDFQEDLLTWVLWLNKMHLTGILDKSRKMGLSWLTQVITAYLVLFFDNQIVYHLSITITEVDNRTPDSLMGKFRMLLNELPEWMRGGWKEFGKSEEGEAIDKLMEIKIPRTGSRVEGQLTGGQAARGGRSNMNVYDEFPFVENARETLNSATSVVDSKLFLGTVNGMNNEFARMRWKPGALVKSYHWSVHPLKDEKWSILERSDPIFDVERWAQEYDMQYETSTSGRVYPRFVSKLREKNSETYDNKWVHVIDEKHPHYDYFQYDPNYDVHVGLDFGLSDPNAAIFLQIKPQLPNWPNPFGNIMIIFGEHLEYGETDDELADMLVSMGYPYGIIVGDERSLNRSNSDGGSYRKNIKKRSGIHVYGRRNSAMSPIKVVRHRIATPGALAILKNSAPKVVESIQNWSFRIDKDTGKPLTGQDPRHNQSFYSHFNKGFAYFCDYYEGGNITAKKTKVVKLDWNTNPLWGSSM